MMKKFLMITAAAALAIPAAALADHHRGSRGDADGDGVVTMAEVDAQLSERFARLDSDGNGAITRAEMVEAHADRLQRRAEKMKERESEGMKEGRKMGHKRMRGQRMGHGRMFERLDANDDGQVTLAEFRARAMDRFAKHDSNGDGTIDADERAAAREARKAARGNRGE